MNSKFHFIVSFLKSAIRIVGCVMVIITKDIRVLAGALLLAEVLGIIEELGDKR